MTCIVAMRDISGRVWMGADSQHTRRDDTIVPMPYPKLFRHGDMMIGAAGPTHYCEYLRRDLVVPRRPDGCTDEDYLLTHVRNAIRDVLPADPENFDALIAFAGRIWLMHPKYGYEINQHFWAIGTGFPYALGYLEGPAAPVPAKLMGALEAAAKYEATVGGPFEVQAL